MKNIILIFLLITMVVGCAITPCRDAQLTPLFIGFSPSELDTTILRAYVPNDSFNQLVDTALITKSFSINSDDTLALDINTSYTAQKKCLNLSTGYDWTIYIPATDTTIYISNIIDSPWESHRYKAICWNPIKSCAVNGKFIPIEYNNMNGRYPAKRYWIIVNKR